MKQICDCITKSVVLFFFWVKKKRCVTRAESFASALIAKILTELGSVYLSSRVFCFCKSLAIMHVYKGNTYEKCIVSCYFMWKFLLCFSDVLCCKGVNSNA